MITAGALRPDGTWPDLNYTERKRAGWPLVHHLNRVTAISTAWACPICTLVNAAASAQCEMECGGVRPDGAAWLEAKPEAKPQWPCVSCTLRNPKASSHCGACGTWRYHRPLP